MSQVKGVRQVGFFDSAGAGQIMVDGNIAYIGHITGPEGTTIVDVSDPKHPKQLAQLTIPQGLHSHKAIGKNGIMLVDFALEGERQRGLTPEQAIYEACLARFRLILMTTLSALLGAVPLIIASGPGSELHRALGITIIGGLVVSQVLTLYTTPVIYLLLDKLHHYLSRSVPRRLVWSGRLGPPE